MVIPVLTKDVSSLSTFNSRIDSIWDFISQVDFFNFRKKCEIITNFYLMINLSLFYMGFNIKEPNAPYLITINLTAEEGRVIFSDLSKHTT